MKKNTQTTVLEESVLPGEQRAISRAWLPVAIFLFLAWAAWRYYYWRNHFIAVRDPDAEDYAQIALQLFLGRGMGSRTLPLCGLEYLRLSGANPGGGIFWPDLHRFPFMPLVEAALFHLYGPTDRACSVASGIFYIASVPLVYLLGRRVFSNVVGILGALFYLLCPLTLGYSISGLTESASTFFIVSVLLLLTGKRSRGVLFLAGLLWGIAYWNRYTVAMLSLPFCVYLWVQDRRRAPGNVATFLLAMAAGMAPELWRNFQMTGDPLFSLTATLMVPYKSTVAPYVHWWYVPLYLKPTQILLAWPGAIWAKWVNECYNGWRYLPLLLGHGALYPFLLLALFLRAENVEQRRLRLLTLALLLMHELTLPFLSNIVRYYAYLSPLLILFACWSLVCVAQVLWPRLWPLDAAAGGRRKAGAAAVLLVLAAPMFIGWMNLRGPAPKLDLTNVLVDTWRSHMKVIQAMVGKNEVVLCDAPWSVAWHADRKSVPLPPGPALVPQLAQDYHLNIGAIYFTPRQVGEWESVDARGWEDVRDGVREIPGFRVGHRFRDGALLLVRSR